MENASKALIIAGAIIVSIVLISLGVYVLNMGSDAMKSADMSDTEIMAFNQQFLNFGGLIDGSRAKQLVNTVNNNNRKYSDDESMQVAIESDNIEALKKGNVEEGTEGTESVKITTYDTSAVKSGYKYKVEFGYETGSTRINSIKINKN